MYTAAPGKASADQPLNQLPTLTHLQFLVIGLLLESVSSGRSLRARLKENGARKSGPAFYQLMARLEDSGLVEGRYVKQSVSGQTVRERHYDVTTPGRTAWRASQEFYAHIAAQVSPSDRLSHA